jgi:sporadic carbohydrate cluster 2OG-Fe(II) oxygenase
MSLLASLVEGPGFVVLPVKNLDKLNLLKSEFIKNISKEDELKDIEAIRSKFIGISKAELNSRMIKLLAFESASILMAEACNTIIKQLCGEKIYLQRRANIIFNIPGEDQRRQWPHSELMSGISPFTFVLWTPFHDINDGSGVFYLNNRETENILIKEHNEGLVNGPIMFEEAAKEHALQVRYGEVVVFNPFVIHGNTNFKSNSARIGCSIRVQSIKKPLMQKNTDFF